MDRTRSEPELAERPGAPASPARRTLSIAALSAAGVALAGTARAQEAFPSRPIRIVVPFAPGGITDVMARTIGKTLGEQIGQSVVIENRPGGGTVIGTEIVVRAKPDGYTLLMVSAPIATNPGLYSKLPYDTLTDLAPLVALSAQGFVISVGEKQPWRTFAELVEAARREEIPYASPGNGTLMHLTGPRANLEYGTKFVHVPYKGSGPAMQDAISGQVPMIIDPASTSLAPIRQGRLRPLAVSHPERMVTLPEVPTVRELGFPKLEATAFSGIVVPAGTPPDVIAKLNTEINKALRSPEVVDRLEKKMGQMMVGGTPEAFGTVLKTETERWVPLIKRLGIRAD